MFRVPWFVVSAHSISMLFDSPSHLAGSVRNCLVDCAARSFQSGLVDRATVWVAEEIRSSSYTGRSASAIDVPEARCWLVCHL